MAGSIFRGLAVLIAILGVLDPSVTAVRPVRPTITILSGVSGDAGDQALSARVERALARRFPVARALRPDTAAVVVTGTRVPEQARESTVPAFAVWPATAQPRVTIEDLAVAPRAAQDSRVPVSATVAVTHGKGAKLDLALSTDGMTIDHAVRTISAEDERVSVRMSAIPVRPGPMAIRLTARVSGTGESHADGLVSIEPVVWRVLVFERRPSWMSTFVRRAIEEDPRFVVVARTVTSAAASTATTDAPATLAEARALGSFDAIVVGAPETLTDADVDGLETFMRRRGGSVVLLMDQRADGPYQRLTGVTRWSEQTSAAGVALTVAGLPDEHVMASELAWPAQLPAGGEALLVRTASAPAAAGERPAMIWQAPAGAGRLIVSGALDAWRMRTQPGSAFDQFWRRTMATAAEASVAPLEVTLEHAVGRPGDPLVAQVRARDAALDPSVAARTLRVSATLVGANSAETRPIRVWPTGPPGEFRVETRMPELSGAYQLTVSAGDDRLSVPITVLADAATPMADPLSLMSAWATSRGGIGIPEDRIDELAGAIETALPIKDETRTWKPMRAPWWILLFASALGVEWWLRRKRGQA